MIVRHIVENQWMQAVFPLVGHVDLSICEIKYYIIPLSGALRLHSHLKDQRR